MKKHTYFSTIIVSIILSLALCLPVSAAIASTSSIPTETVYQSDIASQSSEESQIAANSSKVEQSDALGAESTKTVDKQTNSNTPLFIGAIIAVASFIGVAIVCKLKGNK